MEKEFDAIIQMLDQVSQDRTVPKNIRTKCEESINILKDEVQSLEIRINAVISNLDEISNDPNIPMYTRTHIWNIVSALEAVQNNL